MKIAAKGVNLSEGQNEQVKSYNKGHHLQMLFLLCNAYYALTSQSDHLAGKHGDFATDTNAPLNFIRRYHRNANYNSKEPAKPFNSAL